MPESSKPIPLSHLSASGEAAMVDVSPKEVTQREAVASGAVTMKPAVLDAMLGDALPKGDALATARVAGIMAAKRTSEWIPLCHPLGLDFVGIEFQRSAADTLRILCRARTMAGMYRKNPTAISSSMPQIRHHMARPPMTPLIQPYIHAP